MASAKDVALQELLKESLSDMNYASSASDGNVGMDWFRRFRLVASDVGLLGEVQVDQILHSVVQHLVKAELPALEELTITKPLWEFLGACLNTADDVYLEKMEEALTVEATSMYYATSRPERYDLFIHMSASEMFFVDGDSMILEALSNEHVDISCLQTLHVAYLVQKFLSDLVDRGGKFQVIFFKCNDWFWSRVPQLGLVRTVLMNLLSAIADQPEPKFSVHIFASWWSKKFEKHCVLYQPEFILLNDGENVQQPASTKYQEKSFNSLIGGDLIGQEAASALHCMLIHFIVKRLHVVFTSRLHHKDNAILGFVIRSSSKRFVPFEALSSNCAVLCQKFAKRNTSDDFDVEPFLDGADDCIEKGVCANTREYFVCFGLHALLSERPSMTNIVLAKATLFATVAMMDVGILERAQPKQPCAELSVFLDELSIRCLGFLNAELLENGARDWDLLDGNFIATCLRILSHQPPTDLLVSTGRIKEQWAYVCDEKWDLALPLENVPELPQPLPIQIPNLGELQPIHPMVEKLNVPFKRDEVQKKIEHAGRGAASKLVGWLVCDSLERFNDVIDKDEEERQRKEELSNTKLRRKNEKKRVEYLQNIQETAASMGQTSFLFRNEQQCIVDDKVDDTTQTTIVRQKKQKRSENSKAAQIRQENKIRLVRTQLSNTVSIMEGLLNNAHNLSVDALERDRELTIASLSKFAAELSLSMKGDSNDSDSSDSDCEGEDINNLLLWRGFVASRKDTEQNVIFGRTGTGKSASFTGLTAIDNFLTEQESIIRKSKDMKEEDIRKRLLIGSLSVTSARRRLNMLFFSAMEMHCRVRVLYRCAEIHLGVWKKERERARINKDIADSRAAVPLFVALQRVLTLLERSQIRVPKETRDGIRGMLRYLDLPDAYCKMVDRMIESWEGSDSLPPVPQELLPTHKVLDYTAPRFQLQLMGHLLERPVMPIKDPRVPFNPDKWQRELIDVVDKRGSAVVCAPTSSGKTFISYYCMKKVLRTSNKDVVVYIAPTRALINQAVADVYSRFGKKQYRNPGIHVFGALGGRDFVRQPFNCQVLVTLPETFETILLAPQHQEWVKRIKYVIFDEIHSIDSFGNGAVWERLLMMVRAPFVALSATLGETTELCNWLNRVQYSLKKQSARDSSQSYHVEMIPRDGSKIQRWSDIQKYAFMSKEGEKGLLSVHPMSCVTVTMLTERFPPDLPLVPSEVVALYDLMVLVSRDVCGTYSDVDAAASIITKLKRLNPDTYFSTQRQIVQEEARKYEQELKNELLRWAQMRAGNWDHLGFCLDALNGDDEQEGFCMDITKMVDDVLSHFSHDVQLREQQLTEAAVESASSGDGSVPFPDTFEFVKENMLGLLQDLKQKQLLPTIAFSFEQEECFAMVEYLVEQMEAAEAVYRTTDEFREYERRLKEKHEAQQKLLKTLEAQENVKTRGKKGAEGEDGKMHDMNVEKIDVGEMKDFTVPDILPQFSFGSPIDFSELRDDIEEGSLLKRALQRGIGIHHAGISGKLRQNVERLFRRRLLPIVFATETLALGVHSPCRSVVLAGDHVKLNTTQFRQMAGRAGRRGQDFLGHVVFLGVSFAKIQRLMTSDLMVLKGHLQLDPVTQLRLLQLHDYCSNSEKKQGLPHTDDWEKQAVELAENLHKDPLFFLGRAKVESFEKHQVEHLRATLGLFYEQGLLFKNEFSSVGQLVTAVLNAYNSAGAHNAAFILAFCLTSLRLRDIAESEEGQRQVLECLAYIFTRDVSLDAPLEMHRSVLRDPTLRFLLHQHGKTHRVVLPPLSGGVLDIIQGFSNVVLAHMMSFVVKQGKRLTSIDSALPFQLRGKKGPLALILAASKETGLSKHLDATKGTFFARSPFVALSGVGDDFTCVDDLIYGLRSSLFLDPAMVPCTDFMDTGRHDKAQIIVNACVQDYMRCESQSEKLVYKRTLLQRYNGLSESESWKALDHFFHIVENLDECLEALTTDEEDGSSPLFAEVEAIHKIALRTAVLRIQLDNRRLRVYCGQHIHCSMDSSDASKKYEASFLIKKIKGGKLIEAQLLEGVWGEKDEVKTSTSRKNEVTIVDVYLDDVQWRAA